MSVRVFTGLEVRGKVSDRADGAGLAEFMSWSLPEMSANRNSGVSGVAKRRPAPEALSFGHGVLLLEES